MLACSSYTSARGDTILIIGNPTYETLNGRLTGPRKTIVGRRVVLIDVLSRMGKAAPFTPGYRWEAALEQIQVPAREFVVAGAVRDPMSIPAFAAQHGFFSLEPVARRTPVPPGATLLDNGDAPDWVIVNDDGLLGCTERDPVDSRRAVRVEPEPHHSSAALLLQFPEPRDWSTSTGITFWVRPDRPYPVRDKRHAAEHQTGIHKVPGLSVAVHYLFLINDECQSNRQYR